MKKETVSRRKFIVQSSLAATAISVGSTGIPGCQPKQESHSEITGMPTRTFGKTGEEVSILGYGGGSQFMKMPDGEWEPHLEYAFNAGINYFDTASTYGGDTDKPSESRFGEIIPPFRDKILLLTKIHERDPDKAKAEFERSLNRLKTDYVDILLIHAITPEDLVGDIESGVYQLVQELKAQKSVRFIGFSSMDSAERSKELIEKLDFDITLLAMNPTKYGNFSQVALPAAREKNLGVIAMKVMRDIVNDYAKPKELLDYGWNQDGVSCSLVSMTGMDPLKENINLAYNYQKSSQAFNDNKELEKRLSHYGGPQHLVWARPEYYDGSMIC